MFPMYNTSNEPKIYCHSCDEVIENSDNIIEVEGWCYCTVDCLEDEGYVPHALDKYIFIHEDKAVYLEDIGFFNNEKEANEYGYYIE